MYADVSLCAESIRWMEREREENKYRATKRGENPSLPTQVPPSAPPVCLTALAYGHECQCFSRKHDLGWNNPFGKGLRLSSSVSFFSPFFLSVCSVRLSVRQRLFTAVVATCTPRVARSNLIWKNYLVSQIEHNAIRNAIVGKASIGMIYRGNQANQLICRNDNRFSSISCHDDWIKVKVIPFFLTILFTIPLFQLIKAWHVSFTSFET